MIAITGVSGYIGIHLARYLKDKGEKCVGLIKQNTSNTDLTELKNAGIPYTMVDFFDESSVCAALKGTDLLVHLVGSIYAPKNMTMENLHKDITATVIKAAQKAQIKTIVYVSALGTSLKAAGEYHRTKALAEQQIIQSGIPYLILQPSLVFGKLYGHRNSKLIARFAGLTQKLSFIPLIGSGQNKMQPIYIMDLVECIYKGLTGTARNKTIQLGGPEVLTLQQIAECICMVTSGHVKRCVHLPRPMMYVIASLMEKIKEKPEVTCDQIRMSKEDNICTSDEMDTLFPLEKTSMGKASATLL
ncbi:NAD-dependent epimerase/dehydratase family protein [bacterium]|nr:NAD-dependent epimerase/dehydratase family protein [bacterium]MCP5461561.1 NAD-dependent epimerase/dehydratase family protein [bacterium]